MPGQRVILIVTRDTGVLAVLCFPLPSSRRVQRHGGPNERLERLLVHFVALMKIDGTPGVAFEAGVEEARRVVQRRALEESHLHDTLVSLAGADDSGVRPHWNSERVGWFSPFHLLDDFGIGLLDEPADLCEPLAPPVTQFLDSRIDQLRGRVYPINVFRAGLRLHGSYRSTVNCVSSTSTCYYRISFPKCLPRRQSRASPFVILVGVPVLRLKSLPERELGLPAQECGVI